MAAFYGTVSGSASTTASRQGNSSIKVSAQSWHGSVITRLTYSQSGNLMVEIQTSESSSSTGYTAFYGTFEELIKRRKKGDNEE